MCGIDTEVIFFPGRIVPEKSLLVEEAIRRRGPDACHVTNFGIPNQYSIRFVSSVLHLRGRDTVAQPVESANFILQWNGEIYDGINVALHENDTTVLLDTLEAHAGCPVEQVVGRIKGEFAFVLLDVQAHAGSPSLTDSP